MKTPIKQTAHRLAAVLAIATAFAATGAWAESTTYRQVEIMNYEMDGLPATTEITSTRQLAFAGVKLDDICQCTFITQLYGPHISGYNTVDTSATSWSLWPTCHLDGEGHVDKLAVQCSVYDTGSNSKGVILVLTNGDGGVYVEKALKYYRGGNQYANQNFSMAADGTISSSYNSTSDYRAGGIRIHGMSPLNTKAQLAFPGANLAMFKNLGTADYVAGYRLGKNTGVPVTNTVARYIGYWPTSGEVQKIAVQFTHPTDGNKVAVIELTDGVGGVYAKQVLAVYATGGDKSFQFNEESGEISKINRGTVYSADCYPIEEFHIATQERTPCVTQTPNKIKVFTDPSKTLTLDDIEHGDFTARMCGGWMPASSRETHNTGYNKKVYTDETSGSVTNIIVEFQVRDDSNTKCLVVAFTNGADGIYAEAINARYSTQAIGYEFRDYDGTLYGAQNNKSGEIVAETLTAGGYGAFDLRVEVQTVHEWTLDATKDWSTLSGGETVEADEAVKITVNDPEAVLTVDADVSVGKIEFVGGNCAQLIVASGQTLTAEDITGVTDILNNGTLVKTGDGTVAWPFDTDSKGETVVSNGTLKAASQTGSGTNHVVRVKDGAVFDVNGVQNIHVVVQLEEGATYTNGKVYNYHLYNALLPVKLILDGDAVATTTCAFGLNGPSRNGSWLELGNHTLTVNGGKVFMMYKTTVTGTGTVVVDNGELVSYDLSQGDDWTLDVRANGTVSINGTGLTVGNFVNGGSCSGTAKLTVKGMLTPGSAAIANLTLAAGATVKATGTAQEVSTTFAASGVITVDASEITAETLHSGDVAVLTVPAAFIHSGATWAVSGEKVAGTRAKWRTDAGGETKTLYVGKPTGLMLIFR